MINLDRYELDAEPYKRVINNQIKHQKPIMEVVSSGRTILYKLHEPKIIKTKKGKERIEYKTILCANKVSNISLGNIDKESFITFLKDFKFNLNKCLRLNTELWDLKIIYDKSKIGKNNNYWGNINEGDYFYLIDIRSAYWQIAHKIGYISTELFNSYFELDDYKASKRLCFSFLSRTSKATYFGKRFDGSDEDMVIGCNSEFYKNIYDNIRNLLNNLINEVVLLTDNNYLKYNTDGIYITKEYVPVVKKFLKANGILYKTSLCKKISNFEYVLQNQLMKF